MADGKWILSDLGKFLLETVAGRADICEDCCGAAEHCNCNVGNVSDPRTSITLTWDDGATSKVMFGCTWSNGETKEMCPTQYSNHGSKERWQLSGNGGFSPTSDSSGTPTPIVANLLMTASVVINGVNSTQEASVSAQADIEFGANPTDERRRLQYKRRYLPSNSPTSRTYTTTTDETGSRVTDNDLLMSELSSVFGSGGKPSIQDVQFGYITSVNEVTGYTYTVKWERLASADANPNILTTTTITPDYWEISAP